MQTAALPPSTCMHWRSRLSQSEALPRDASEHFFKPKRMSAEGARSAFELRAQFASLVDRARIELANRAC